MQCTAIVKFVSKLNAKQFSIHTTQPNIHGGLEVKILSI